MDRDIELALDFWRHMNSEPSGVTYARFSAAQFKSHRVVFVETGLMSNGRKMSPHTTRHFALDPNGHTVLTWESGL